VSRYLFHIGKYKPKLKLVKHRILHKLHKAPITGMLQVRSLVGFEELLERGLFKDPDTIYTTFMGLGERVAYGMEGQGSTRWNKSLKYHEIFPHETNIISGIQIHIPEDIGGGLDDSLREHGRLPLGEDYRNLYAPVRSSLNLTSFDLKSILGSNTTSLGIDTNERLTQLTGKDIVQGFRDREFTNRGGPLFEGLPPQELIDISKYAIRNDFDVHVQKLVDALRSKK
jgi:hypothetical protein